MPVVKHLFADQEDVGRLKEFERNTRRGGDRHSIKEDNLTSFVCSLSDALKFYSANPDFV